MTKLTDAEEAEIVDEVERQMPKIGKIVTQQSKLMQPLTDVAQKVTLCMLVGAWIAQATDDEKVARDLAAQMGEEIKAHALMFLNGPVTGNLQ